MDSIIAKIKKLLALAGNNSNEAEAARALEMASSLMMKHGIEEDAVKGEAKQEIRVGTRFEDQRPFHRVVAQAVAELMGCSSYWYAPIKGVAFAGRPLNVATAEELFVYVVLQIEGFYRRDLPKGLTQRERADFRQTYKLAAAYKVQGRVNEIVRNQSLPTGSTGSTALVVQHRELLRTELEEFNRARGIGNSRPMNPKFKSVEALLAGRLAGDQVELAKGVDQ